MGTTQSQFQDQFYSRYSFIQILEDQHYGSIKIYRKSFINYDYIMIMQTPLSSLLQQQLSSLQQKLQLVRLHQTNNVMKLYHFRVLKCNCQNKIQCQGANVRLYAEYFNHTLDDYLSALRTKKMHLSIDELFYIVKSVINALLSLRKMRISELDLHARNVFLSMQGQVFLNPLYFLQRAFKAHDYKNPPPIESKYQKFSLRDTVIQAYPEKQQIKNLFLQLTGSLVQHQFPASHPLFNSIDKSTSLETLYHWIPGQSELSFTSITNIRNEQQH